MRVCVYVFSGTAIELPFESEKQDSKAYQSLLQNLDPSVLLFLRRLRQFIAEDKCSSVVKTITRKDMPGNLVEIHTEVEGPESKSSVMRWLKVHERAYMNL